jgi:carboxyl-terminal processing protease
MKNSTKLLYVTASLAIVVGVFVGGLYVGYTKKPYSERVSGVVNMANASTGNADFDTFWRVWNTIDEKYPEAKNVSAQDRLYGAISGLVGSLGDPYSVYFPPAESKQFEETIKGSFEGIGMEIGIKDKVLTVVAPLKNTPAEKAGIKAGDVILEINKTETDDMTVEEAVRQIRGQRGTSVELSLYRKGETKPIVVSVMRDVISIPMIETKKLSGDVFVVSLYSFGASSAQKFAQAMQEFSVSGAKNLVIDLRNNPGGYLDSAIDISSMFLPKDAVIVTEEYGEGRESDVFKSKGYGFVDPKKVKIVILLNGGSASASEIVAGALSDHDSATLIGEKTYGKGSVQEVVNITRDTTLKITVAKWLTPDGLSISKKGIEPDIAVETTSENTKNGKDPVMDRALEFFRTGK